MLVAVDTLPQGGRGDWLPAIPRGLVQVLFTAGLILAALVGIALIAGAPATPIPDNGLIAFAQTTRGATSASGQARIMVASTADDGVVSVIDVPGKDHSLHLGGAPRDPRNTDVVGPAVAWSPDGTRLAFRLFNDAPGIYVTASDGRPELLVELPLTGGLAWAIRRRSTGLQTARGSLTPTHITSVGPRSTSWIPGTGP